MEILIAIGLVGLVYLIYKSHQSTSKGTEQAGSLSTLADKPRQVASTVTTPMPAGFQVYIKHCTVAGIHINKEAARAFIAGKNHQLEFEPEPDNQTDKYAIKVFGTSSGARHFLGYVPKGYAEHIVGAGVQAIVIPRINRVFSSEKGAVDIRFQLIGPKSRKKQFDQYLLDKAASPQQLAYLEFFAVQNNKGVSAGEAARLIEEHKLSASKQQIDEWEEYLHILAEFEDSDFRDSYSLKKVTKTALSETLQSLTAEGRTYQDLSDNIDDVVDRLVELHPGFQKIERLD